MFKINSYILSLSLVAVSLVGLLMPTVVYAATPVFHITTEDVDFETGKSFMAKVNMDTLGLKIRRVDMMIKYDPKVLEVVDQSSTRGVQIDDANDLGAMQQNYVDETNGQILISVVGDPRSSGNLNLANISFITKGQSYTMVAVDINGSKVYTEDSSMIGFTSTDLVITRIVEDYSGIRILHTQSTYLAREGTEIQIDVSIDSDTDILEKTLYYQTLPEKDKSYSNDWLTKELEESGEDGKYEVKIPARDVKRPGMAYYFKVRTAKAFTTVPRPVTLETTYKISVIEAEVFDDNELPVVTFNPPSAEFDDTLYVTARPNKPNITIYCTDDGSVPNDKSFINIKPFLLDKTTTLKCFGIDAKGKASEVKTGEYVKSENTVTASFTATPTQIVRGQSSLLSWTTNDAAEVVLEPDFGQVNLNGNLEVSPFFTTTYILTIIDKEGKRVQKKATVYVSEGVVNYPDQSPPTGPEMYLVLGLAISGVLLWKSKVNE